MRTLLEQFLAEECPRSMREELLETIRTHTTRIKTEITGNRFDLTFHWNEGVVVIEDDFDTSEDGTQTLRIDDFAAALTR